jgi:predicted small lipoprotein YifL
MILLKFISILLFFFITSCGIKGPPLPPQPEVQPAVITEQSKTETSTTDKRQIIEQKKK